jgi:hypothetical protein
MWTPPDGTTDETFDIDLPAVAMGRRILRRIGVAIHTCRFHPGMNARLGSIVSQRAVRMPIREGIESQSRLGERKDTDTFGWDMKDKAVR